MDMKYKVVFHPLAIQDAVWEDNPAYRRFVIGNYLALYQISDNSRTVTICRVVDARRNITSSDMES